VRYRTALRPVMVGLFYHISRWLANLLGDVGGRVLATFQEASELPGR